jgi:hypothetical protein
VPIVMSNDGRRWAASILTLNAAGFRLGLFANDFVPTPDNVLSDFVAPTYDGYAPVALGAWGAVFLNLYGDGQATYQPIIFRVGPAGGGDTVYGYLVFNLAGFVLWSELNPAGGVQMARAGDVFPILPQFSAGALA